MTHYSLLLKEASETEQGLQGPLDKLHRYNYIRREHLFTSHDLRTKYLAFMNFFLDWIVGPQEKYNCQDHQIHEALNYQSVCVYKEEYC